MREPRYLSLFVSAGEDGQTLGHLLKSELHIPAGMIASLKWREDGICLNGKQAHTTARVRAGDEVRIRLDIPGDENRAEPVPIPLTFPYEDEDLAVLEKPAGLVVHGAVGGAPTVQNALAALWGVEQPVYPVHRLDRGTTGLLVVAKNAYTAERLRRALHTGRFQRDYLAIASGLPPDGSGLIDAPIGPAGDGRYAVREDGKGTRSEYEVLAHFTGGCLLRLRLDTGRTHQIRVHLASLGCPLFGDTLYGAPEAAGLTRPALHAAHLGLEQPVTRKRLELTSPLPEDLRSFLRERHLDWEEEALWRL